MNPHKRYRELDSLRGLAAFTVFLSHLLILNPKVWDASGPDTVSSMLRLVIYTPFKIFFSGHEAVILFFVLSGFVLAMPFVTGRDIIYRTYAIKRICRIYLPYIAAVAFAMVARTLLYRGPINGLSNWYNQSWMTPVSWKGIVDHVIMIGCFDNSQYDPVLWTLIHEMRISLIFPVLVWLVGKLNHKFIFIPITGTVAMWLYDRAKFFGHVVNHYDFFDTMHYAGFFMVGIYLAKKREMYISRLLVFSSLLRFSLFISLAFVYTNGAWLPYIVDYDSGVLHNIASKIFFQEWLVCVSVFIAIPLILTGKWPASLMLSKPIVLLGDVSYSLYLTHAVVMKIVISLFFDRFPLFVNIILIVAISIVTAWMSWKYVEIPSIRLGKFLTTKQRKVV